MLALYCLWVAWIRVSLKYVTFIKLVVAANYTVLQNPNSEFFLLMNKDWDWSGLFLFNHRFLDILVSVVVGYLAILQVFLNNFFCVSTIVEVDMLVLIVHTNLSSTFSWKKHPEERYRLVTVGSKIPKLSLI